MADEQPEKGGNLDREDRRSPDHHVEGDKDAKRKGAPLLSRGLACRIETDKEPEREEPEDRAGIDHVDIATVGKTRDIAHIKCQQLDKIQAEEAFHGQHDAPVEGVAARIRPHQIDQSPGADDDRHDERADAIAGLWEQEIAEQADEREGQHAARIIGEQDEGNRRQNENAVEARDLVEPADEIDAEHAGEVGKRDLLEKQRRGAVVAEPEREAPRDVDRVLKDLRAAKGDLLQPARVGEIECRIKQILVDAGKKDLDQQDRENEGTADPENEGQTAPVRHHAKLAEDTDDQNVAKEIDESDAIDDRGIDHDQSEEADQRHDRQRLLRQSAVKQVEQRNEEQRDFNQRDMGEAQRHDMRIDDGEKPIIHHRQRHDYAHKPTVLPDGLGDRPGLWVLKAADAHEA